MKKLLLVIISFFMMCSSMLATGHEAGNVSQDTICAIGSITEQSVEVFAIDEEAEHFVVVLNGTHRQTLEPNKEHYAKVKFENLEPAKDYTAYVIAYKSGQEKYSQIQKFTTLDPNKVLEDVKTPVVITEYKVTPTEIILTLAPSNVVGNIRWYLNDELKGESFSVIGGFKHLKQDTNYKITLKYNIANNEHITECMIKTAQEKQFDMNIN